MEVWKTGLPDFAVRVYSGLWKGCPKLEQDVISEDQLLRVCHISRLHPIYGEGQGAESRSRLSSVHQYRLGFR